MNLQRIRKTLASGLALIVIFTLGALSAVAQIGSQGQIQGFVRDQAGAAVGNATVVLVDTGTGRQLTVQADADGYFVAANIPPSIYEVSVEQTGFKKFVLTNVKLDAADRRTVDINLEIGAVAETVTITGSTAEVQSSTAQVGRVIEGQQVRDLSLNGRNSVQLAVTQAGVSGGNINNFNFTPGFGFNVNGSRADETSILLDGAQQVRTRSAGTTTGVINPDTVQEVQILTSNYAPEFGRANGGTLSFVTRPGTREFNGSIYHFIRNDKFDANEWGRNRTPLTDLNRVSERPPKIRFNQPGYSIGGPVFIPKYFNTDRSKLFFFFAQEFVRFRNESTPTATVPSVALRSGDVREFGAGTDTVFGTADDPVRDPVTQIGFIDPVRGPGFISPSRFSANGSAILNAYPLPNLLPGAFPGESTNYITSGSNATDTNNTTLRMDYIQGIHRVTFRGSLYDWKIRSAFRGAFDFGPDDNSRPNRSASVTLNSTLSPTLINDLTVGASADVVKLNVRGRPSRLDRGINYPYVFPGEKELEDKVPTISISGLTDIDPGPYPASSAGPIYTISNTLTNVRGSHTIRGGINIERSGQNDFDQINIVQVPGATNNQNGRFEFRDNVPGGTTRAQVNALLGLFSNYGEIGRKNYTPWRATTFEAFVQDNWKATQKLTLEYGVRYNLWPPWYSLWDNIATFRPEFYQPGLLGIRTTGPQAQLGRVFINGPNEVLSRYNGISLPGDGFSEAAQGRVGITGDPRFNDLFRGIPNGLSETHKNVFEPRLGLAYAYNEKTVLRLGFGIFHNRVLLNDSSLLGGNAPLQAQVVIQNGLIERDIRAASRTGTQADQSPFPFSLTMQDPEFKHPTAYNWSLTVQRELPADFIVELGYVGKRSIYLPRERDINSILPGQIFTRNASGQVVNTTGTSGQNLNGTVEFPNALRPYVGHGQIRLAENAANAIYHSGQLTLKRRFTNGLAFDMAYTFSKSIDNASDKRTILPNAFDDRFFRAVSDFDRTHVFTVNYSYELPFGQGRRFLNNGGIADKLIGGWQFTGITFLRSGTPFSIGSPVDALGVGAVNNQFASFRGAPVRQRSNPQLGESYFEDVTGFTIAAPGTFGTVPRNFYRRAGFQSHDLSLFKNFRVTEGTTLQFRVEAFNFVNHPNQGDSNGNVNDQNNTINTNFSSPNYGNFSTNANGTANTRNFGLVTGLTGDRRQVQLALKFLF